MTEVHIILKLNFYWQEIWFFFPFATKISILFSVTSLFFHSWCFALLPWASINVCLICAQLVLYSEKCNYLLSSNACKKLTFFRVNLPTCMYQPCALIVTLLFIEIWVKCVGVSVEPRRYSSLSEHCLLAKITI